MKIIESPGDPYMWTIDFLQKYKSNPAEKKIIFTTKGARRVGYLYAKEPNLDPHLTPHHTQKFTHGRSWA